MARERVTVVGEGVDLSGFVEQEVLVDVTARLDSVGLVMEVYVPPTVE